VIATERRPVQLATRLLRVSEPGYYEWRGRAPSVRAVRHAWLTEQIRAVHLASRGTYGSRRMHAELTLGLGIPAGHGAVEMLMHRAGIKGLPGNRRPRPRHQTPTAGDLVHRQFTRSVPDQLWVTDITGHPTGEGKVYCAVVLDACSRRVAGWSTTARRPLPGHQRAGHGHPQPDRPAGRDDPLRPRGARRIQPAVATPAC
jgi:transposase InsO family protein